MSDYSWGFIWINLSVMAGWKWREWWAQQWKNQREWRHRGTLWIGERFKRKYNTLPTGSGGRNSRASSRWWNISALFTERTGDLGNVLTKARLIEAPASSFRFHSGASGGKPEVTPNTHTHTHTHTHIFPSGRGQIGAVFSVLISLVLRRPINSRAMNPLTR